MYKCSGCGYKSNKWLGKCLECSMWNSFVEISSNIVIDKIYPKLISDIVEETNSRLFSDIGEWDRTLGGGLVKGSVTLLTGEPGVGKSTLLLQAMFKYSLNYRALYVSGEESEQQIKSRASRLGLKNSLRIISHNNIDEILECAKDVDVIAIDSIQTLFSKEVDDVQGTLPQIKDAISKIINVAKKNNLSFIVVGHVTKDGKIAGPKMLEHMVDTLIELEGDKDFECRILRATKNRFGSLNEIGLFNMNSNGIYEVKNPSEFFIGERSISAGSIVTPILEGNRVFLVEIQSLVSSYMFNFPRRVGQGLDSSNLQIISAIIERYLSLELSSKDIFFNIPGGIKTKDPSVGLAIVMSIFSSYKNIPIDIAAIGEVGLTGEIRKVSFSEKRIKELERHGFKKVFVPFNTDISSSMELIKLKNIREIPEIISKLF